MKARKYRCYHVRYRGNLLGKAYLLTLSVTAANLKEAIFLGGIHAAQSEFGLPLYHSSDTRPGRYGQRDAFEIFTELLP